MQENQNDDVESTNKGGAPVGNKNAAKARQMSAMLEHALNANNRHKLREGIDKISNAFAEGEVWAVNFVFDRIEGKPTQKLEGSGEGGEFISKVLIEFIDADKSAVSK